jgi:subtilase family serine protease
MRNFRSSVCSIVASTLLTAICLTTICAATISLAEAPDRIAGAIDSSKMVVLKSQIQRRAQPQYDRGRVESSFQLHVTLLTVPSHSQAEALTQLLAEQQDPKSPNFHKWITSPQYADRFGLSHNDVEKISAWLKSQGFTVDKVANGRNWIVFGGTASQIESAFRTEIHRYNVNGELHFANAAPPSIPAALAGVATGFRGMSDFGPKPMIRKAAPRARNVRPDYYDPNTGVGDFVAPGDIATIYDLNPLYTAGTPIDGTGEKLAIMGQTDVYLADLNDFRTGFGLPTITGCTTATSGANVGAITSCTPSSTANFQYVLNGSDPGVSLNDLTEADLDLEWSAATARGAQIIFVNTAQVNGGVFESFYFAIDSDPVIAPVISLSYGLCEWDDGGNILTSTGTGYGADETQLMMASTEGITFINSSGDSGSAECDPPLTGPPDPDGLATGGLAVSYPASSPWVTGLGGTAVDYPSGFSPTYWGTSNGTNGGTAQNPPLPETAWNDDVELPLAGAGGTALSWQENPDVGIFQSGGGVSNCALQNDPTDNLCVSGFPVPTWQKTLSFTAPATTGRYSPDVSLLASPEFPGYVYCTPQEELTTDPTYETSASSCASGIPAAVNGLPVGDPTTVSPSIVGGTSASAPIFAGIVTMLNQYLNGANSPGLGPINSKLYELAATSPSAFHHVITGDNMVYCSGDTPSPSYEINPAYLCSGTTGQTQSFGWQASNADPTTGYNLVTGLGSVDVNALFTAWNATTPPTVTLGLGVNSLQVNPGQAGTATINVSPSGTTALTFTCSETSAPALAASGSVCTVTPATPTTAASVSVSITTVAPTAQLRRPLGSGQRIFFAALLPGLLGIVFTAGSRKRAARGIRFLSLILVLGFSTLWLASCGSSNSTSTSNPGTPAGTYPVVITTTTGGGSITLNLVVQ